MKTLLAILLTVLGVLVALAIGGGLLVLLAFGTGLLINRIMGFDSFQTTVIVLLGIGIFGVLVERTLNSLSTIASYPSKIDYDEDADDEEYEDEDEDEDEDNEEAIHAVYLNPRLPRWRQPLKNVDFSNATPEGRCPCGSGRKYKNCHGGKQAK